MISTSGDKAERGIMIGVRIIVQHFLFPKNWCMQFGLEMEFWKIFEKVLNIQWLIKIMF